MTVLIGVTTAWSVETWGEDPERPGGIIYTDLHYAGTLYRSGALPVLLAPPLDSCSEGEWPELAAALLDRVSGLFFSGGGGAKLFKAPDLPGLERQQPLRYRFESLLIREAWRRGMPAIGACRGHQMIAEALGGKIREQTVEGHQQQPDAATAHPVALAAGSRLAALAGADSWEVNSYHCQVIEQQPPGFRVSARAPEGFIEAIEAEGPAFWLGFQFHPEMMAGFDETARRIFRSFIQAAADYANQ